MKVKEESEKADLKLIIQKICIMAFSPITSWQIEGEKWKQWQILFSWAANSLWADSLEEGNHSLEGKLWQT